LKRLSTFTGKYSSDDLFLLEKVKELLERNKRLLIILDIPKQNMDIYHY
jgi:phosphatidylserine decarboxylase